MKIITVLLVILITISSWSGEYNMERELTLDAQAIKLLEIDCGAGFLKVQGVDDAKAIEVQAEIYVSNIDRDKAEDFLEKTVRLYLERDGDQAILESDYEYKNSLWEKIFDDRPNVRIDLTVQVPRTIDLKIDDGSGYIVVEKIDGSVRLDDGSGETTLRGISGDVWLDDGSGEIHISDVGGDVEIDDGSGVIIVRDVSGNVRVDDGSGSIEIRGVAKDVIIEEDGSGSIDISEVKGKVLRRDD